MKSYDFKLAKKIIEEKKNEIEEAALGMQEDCFWTADIVFSDNEFQKNLDEIETVAGISGSYWATPVLLLNYKNGSQETFECFSGNNQGDRGESALFASGPLSSEVRIPAAKKYIEQK